jgi:hypothetical protein
MSLPVTLLVIGIADMALIAGLVYVLAMPVRLLPHRAARDEPEDTLSALGHRIA